MSNNLSTSLKKSRAHKTSASAFLKRIQNTFVKEKLLKKNENILVAVSGGSDSIALLYTLLYLQKRTGWSLAIAHVNYNLRGSDSTKDSLFVQKLAKKWNLPCYVLSKKFSRPQSEEKLRDIRYHFFQSLVIKHAFTSVTLGHHQDDQAETVLLHLIRGAGIKGLAAMQMKRGIYIRPFLTTPKAEILQFLKQENISFRHDKSNDELLYLRNKVRLELLPLLATYNPNIKKTLADSALYFQQALKQLEKKPRKKRIAKGLITESVS